MLCQRSRTVPIRTAVEGLPRAQRQDRPSPGNPDMREAARMIVIIIIIIIITIMMNIPPGEPGMRDSTRRPTPPCPIQSPGPVTPRDSDWGP
jgi:hypothetical protein